MSPSQAARRVALLARPGAARDRMRDALAQAGANIVLEADPTTTDQTAVLGAAPEVALIVLDAATDEALGRFDDMLANPAVEVLFEEAELAVGRVGWDAARWVRHLRAKLGHSSNVLPPERATETAGQTQPIADVASIARSTPPPSAVVVESAPQASSEPPVTAPKSPVAGHHDVPTKLELAPQEPDGPAGHDAADRGTGRPAPFVAKLELELVDDTPTEIRVEGIEGLEPSLDEASESVRFEKEMTELQKVFSAMELVTDTPARQMRGAVLVMAGIGGPDAVRQLLGALPEGFKRAVLVQQRLDGGHYDKLVAQMQRATTLPVRLAAAGNLLEAATVYILPPSVGVEATSQGLVFSAEPGDLLQALPAGDSAVLMLSGSDPAHVDAVMKMAAAGALVAGQALDGCYDAAAPGALVARGGLAGKPQELARHLAERWH